MLVILKDVEDKNDELGTGVYCVNGDNDDGFEEDDDCDDNDEEENDELGTRPPSFVSTSDQFEIRRRCLAE